MKLYPFVGKVFVLDTEFSKGFSVFVQKYKVKGGCRIVNRYS